MNTNKFRKKPVVIEAFRYGIDPRPDWFMDKVTDNTIITYENYCNIKTLEGVMVAGFGDYVIKGVKGEIYPCKPDIFEVTYEVEKASQKLETHKYEVFGFINDQNSLVPEDSRDRVTLAGLEKNKLCRVMIQVVAET